MAASKEQSIYEMGEEMKKFEKILGDIRISPDNFWIIRIDGKKFSSFTTVFKKKGELRDESIARAMTSTAGDLLKEFNALTAYTQSDEITLVFAPKRYFYEKAIEDEEPQEVIEKHKKALETNEIMFNGKVQKIVSLAAGFASARFNHHLRFNMMHASPGKYTHIHDETIGKAYFDARIFELPTPELVWKCVMWRIKDGIRASKNTFGRNYYSQKQLQKMTSNQIIKKVAEEKGINYYDINIFARSGMIIKEGLRYETIFVPRANDHVRVLRSHIRHFTADDLIDAGIDFLFKKKIQTE